jgi:hypothetical protein
MKHIILLIGLLIPSLAFAKNYPINWYKITGTGGIYQVSGTILGKAMTGLSQGQGMVLVLVTLQ